MSILSLLSIALISFLPSLILAIVLGCFGNIANPFKGFKLRKESDSFTNVPTEFLMCDVDIDAMERTLKQKAAQTKDSKFHKLLERELLAVETVKAERLTKATCRADVKIIEAESFTDKVCLYRWAVTQVEKQSLKADYANDFNHARNMANGCLKFIKSDELKASLTKRLYATA